MVESGRRQSKNHPQADWEELAEHFLNEVRVIVNTPKKGDKPDLLIYNDQEGLYYFGEYFGK